LYTLRLRAWHLKPHWYCRGKRPKRSGRHTTAGCKWSKALRLLYPVSGSVLFHETLAKNPAAGRFLVRAQSSLTVPCSWFTGAPGIIFWPEGAIAAALIAGMLTALAIWWTTLISSPFPGAANLLAVAGQPEIVAERGNWLSFYVFLSLGSNVYVRRWWS